MSDRGCECACLHTCACGCAMLSISGAGGLGLSPLLATQDKAQPRSPEGGGATGFPLDPDRLKLSSSLSRPPWNFPFPVLTLFPEPLTSLAQQDL